MKLNIQILFVLIWTLGTSISTAIPVLAQSDEDRIEQGQKLFIRCRACHNIGTTTPIKPGPDLKNMFGRKAGTSAYYNDYSKAMKNADFVWTEEALDKYLSEPRSFLPGNNMAFAGVRNETDRKNLILYLKEATSDKTNKDTK